jgi:hypothetical protein
LLSADSSAVEQQQPASDVPHWSPQQQEGSADGSQQLSSVGAAAIAQAQCDVSGENASPKTAIAARNRAVSRWICRSRIVSGSQMGMESPLPVIRPILRIVRGARQENY